MPDPIAMSSSKAEYNTCPIARMACLHNQNINCDLRHLGTDHNDDNEYWALVGNIGHQLIYYWTRKQQLEWRKRPSPQAALDTVIATFTWSKPSNNDRLAGYMLPCESEDQTSHQVVELAPILQYLRECSVAQLTLYTQAVPGRVLTHGTTTTACCKCMVLYRSGLTCAVRFLGTCLL